MELKFKVTGMTCAACSSRVEKVVSQVPGVTKAEVNLLAGSMVVTADSAEVTQNIISAVAGAGYGAELPGQKAQAKAVQAPDTGLKQMVVRIVTSFVFLGVLMYFTMGHMVKLPVPGWYVK